MKPKIEVFSTFARDVFLTEEGRICAEQPGGPATFIQQTLNALGSNYLLRTSNTVVVEILLTAQGEFGRIRDVPTRKMIKPLQSSDAVLISTLLDEWILPQTSKQIFLDIQGYVRNGDKFGGMKPYVIPPQTECVLTCVKAEQDEAEFLPPDFLERQKNKQLVITKGREGAELFVRGEKYIIPTIPMEDLPDTVGAGDTWFSAYVAYQLQGDDCIMAAEKATTFTTQFLQRKRRKI